MKHFALGFLALTVLATAAPASAMAEEECKAMYPIPNRTVNGIDENTGHDPRAFLIRRCLAKVRAEKRKAAFVERQQIRAAARYDKTSAVVQQRRIKSEDYTQDAIRRQLLKQSRFRSSTHTLDRTQFYEARQSRRSLIRGEEGVDRINAIRRRLMNTKGVDPCTSVLAIRKFNNPCSRYGSLKDE